MQIRRRDIEFSRKPAKRLAQLFPPVPYEIDNVMVSIFIFLSVIGTSFRA
jgi:hypothetical protein